MIPVSRSEIVEFVPYEFAAEARAAAEEAGEDLARFDSPPVYLIAVPTMLEKSLWKRAVLALGARYPQDVQLYACARAGVLAVVEDDAQGKVLEVIDCFEAAAKQGDETDAELAKDMAEVERALHQHYPPYAEMVADRSYYTDVATVVAAQHFLRGWRNLDLSFARERNLVPDALLAELPAGHVTQIGGKALQLMRPGRRDIKNSAPPSPSSSARATSTAASSPATAAKAGKSAAKSSKPTPA